MKVIREGKLPEDKIFRGDCGHCKSVIEAKRSELYAKSDGRNGTDYEAKCPVCSTVMFFEEVDSLQE